MPWPRLLTAEEKQSLTPRQARLQQVVSDGSGMVEAGWAWYERGRGIVAWGFRNLDTSQRSVILLRNSYYLGGAYWSLYASNPTFRTSFINGGSTPRPLAERGVPQNTPPLTLVQFDGPGKSIVCFVFILSAGQAWAMLEGGFSEGSPPSEPAIYEVAPASRGDYCIGYDQEAVKDWNYQSRSSLGGYTPNPSTFNTWVFQADSTAPFQKLFRGDSVTPGRCAPMKHETVVRESSRETTVMFPPVFPDVLSPPLNP